MFGSMCPLRFILAGLSALLALLVAFHLLSGPEVSAAAQVQQPNNSKQDGKEHTPKVCILWHAPGLHAGRDAQTIQTLFSSAELVVNWQDPLGLLHWQVPL